ncbi:MAG: DUF2207 domain-containing protein [Candidatus Kerfeldbacteria bacterium]|nr:DUF2207 domain-containing protein [Candidatus Kerfeldbacteria bacterium]
MRRWFLLVVLIFLPWSAQGYKLKLHVDYPPTIDYIDSYDVHIIAQADGSLDVTETINYYFGESTPAHGIERYIPQRYTGTVLDDTLAIQLDSVVDDDGEAWPVEEFTDGGYTIWRIGSAATTVQNLQTYQLHYTVQWAMTDYDDYIELYWDAIGTEWSVPIEDIEIRLVVPPDSQLTDYPMLCYYGSYGANNNCSAIYDDNQLYTVSIDRLEAYEGVTLIAAFAPETIHLPSAVAYWFHQLLGNWSLLLIPFWLLIGLALWWFGRPKRADKPLIPIYEIPPGMNNASQAEYLLTGKVTDRSFTAELVQAAIRGEIIFNYDEQSKTVATLERTDKTSSGDKLAAVMRPLVFGDDKVVELKKKVVYRQSYLLEATRLAKETLQQHGWMDTFKQTIITGIAVYGLIGFIGGGFLISWGNSSGGRHLIVTGVTLLITGLGMFFIRGRKLPLNVGGANQQRLVEGFKWFLRVTETERLKFSQAPKLTPKLFEDFLPYAIVFGVEKEWIKQFEHILQEPPAWLHGTNRIVLWSALSSVGHTTQAFKVPVSARAGGSGYSGGGGFSGGGFGGGGGGRW